MTKGRCTLEETLYFDEDKNKIYIKAAGHVTAALCPDLKKAVLARLDQDPVIEEVILDLSSCDYMDSTFMGLIVGMNKKLKARTGRRIEINKPTDQCYSLLKGLGIVKLLNLVHRDILFPEGMQKITKKLTATADFILCAHENLVELSDCNKKKFAALNAILKSQIEKNQSEYLK